MRRNRFTRCAYVLSITLAPAVVRAHEIGLAHNHSHPVEVSPGVLGGWMVAASASLLVAVGCLATRFFRRSRQIR